MEKPIEPIITHRIFIAGKVTDVVIQLKMMSKQFPNKTIREMLDSYGVKEMILQ